MKEQFTAFGRKVWGDFRKFSSGQKAVTIAAIAALFVGGFLLLTHKPGTNYAPLYTNLAPSDASAIIDKLNAAGTPYELEGSGTEIMVPQADVYSSRISLSSAGLPSSSSSNFPLLQQAGVTASQFQQQVAYQADLQNELAKTIESISGIQGASVNLAIPQQNVFNDNSQKPTAAVMLSVAPTTTLTSGQVQSITNLVSSSVPGLSTGNVTVSDSNGNVLSTPGQGINSAASAATQSQATQAYDDRLASSLQSMLDSAIGPGNAVVQVNANLNFDQQKTTTNSYLYNKNGVPVNSATSVEKYTGSGSTVGGTLGSSTDTTTSGTAGLNGGPGKYSKTVKNVNNSLGTVQRVVQTAPGAVTNQGISVLVNKSAKGVNLAAITSLIKSGAGYNATRGDTLSVQAMPFSTSASKTAAAAAAAAAKAAAAQTSQQKLIAMAKEGLLGLIVLAVLIGTWLSSRRRRKAARNAVPNDDVLGLDEIEYVAPEPERPIAPVVDFQDVRARRRALEQLADEQPDDVARVLSGWLHTREA